MNTSLRAIWLFMLCFGTLSSLAQSPQTRIITGTVYDEKGVSLPGAGIAVKGTKIAASSNSNGRYSIGIPQNATTLVVSYIGMITKEVVVGNRTTVNINLSPAANQLNDVVVIGYGSVRKSQVTTSISSVSEKDIKSLPVAGVDQALQGKVSGVSISNNGGQPGGGVSVRVRGITSVNGSEPLYVIDGVPILTSTGSVGQDQLGGKAGQTSQSVMATLNPNDIASVDILKDASAQAIYGSMAANGVVLITTKRGKSGEGKISYDTYYGVQDVPKMLSIMNLSQYAQYYNSVVEETAAYGLTLQPIGEFKNPSLLGKGTDWQDAIYQTGHIVNHQIAFSGGHDKTTYYFSGNYFDQTGTVIGSGFKRFASRINLDQQVRSWLKAGVSANLSRTTQKIALTDGTETPTSIVLYNSPATPIRGTDGQYVTTTSLGENTFGSANGNPIATAELRDVRSIQSKAFGNIYADLQFMKYLSLRNEVGYDFQLSENSAFQPEYTNSQTNQTILSPSKLIEQRNNSYFWVLRNYLTFNPTFDKHAINVVLGHEAQRSHYDNVQVGATGMSLNLPSTGAGTINLASTTNGKGDWSMESYFTRANYTYDGRYSLTGSLRRDASSSFGPNSRVGYFSAASAGWTITNEVFAKNIRHIDYLKLRVGVGSVGNQNSPVTNAYSTNIRLFTVAPFGPGGIPANVGNPDLSWESVVTYNAGLDATFFNKKLELSVDVYNKKTTDMILSTTLPVFSGLDPNPPVNSYKEIEPPVTNAGEMSNKGIDVSLTTYNIQQKDFEWKTNVIFSHYKNKLIRLNAPGALLRGQAQDFTGNSSVVNITQAGGAVGMFYGYVTDGLFTSTDQLNELDYGYAVGPQGLYLGDVRYKDLNGDGKIGSEDVTFIGDPNPKFTYGMTNTFRYKNFDFSFFLQGVYGSKIFNWTRKYTESLSSVYLNQSTDVMDRYTPSNPTGTVPRYNQFTNNNLRNSDRYIESGSYLRIQNISLGYNLPAAWVKKVKMASARIYVTAQNVYTFTKYSGYDPEIGAFNQSVLSQNVDNGHYPNPRTFNIGANVEF